MLRLPAIPAKCVVAPALAADARPADIVQLPGSLENRRVVRGERAALARRQVFKRLEAKTRRVAQRARAAQLVNRAAGLSGVFDNFQAVLARDGLPSRHVARP